MFHLEVVSLHIHAPRTGALARADGRLALAMTIAAATQATAVPCFVVVLLANLHSRLAAPDPKRLTAHEPRIGLRRRLPGVSLDRNVAESAAFAGFAGVIAKPLPRVRRVRVVLDGCEPVGNVFFVVAVGRVRQVM